MMRLLHTAIAAAFLLANSAGTACDLSCAWQSQVVLASVQASNHDACCDHGSPVPPKRHQQHKNSPQDCPPRNGMKLTALSPSLTPVFSAHVASLPQSSEPSPVSIPPGLLADQQKVEVPINPPRIFPPLRV
jgi:hypothetical protein